MENMENNFYEQERRLEQGAVAGESLGRYTAKTFLLMFLGLMVTFLTAIFFTETRRAICWWSRPSPLSPPSIWS